MTRYTLTNTPNQMFNTNINGKNFEFTFRTFRGILYCTVAIDGVVEAAGARATPNTSIFPRSVNDAAGGVFSFVCVDNRYPTYDIFGENCFFALTPYGE